MSGEEDKNPMSVQERANLNLVSVRDLEGSQLGTIDPEIKTRTEKIDGYINIGHIQLALFEVNALMKIYQDYDVHYEGLFRTIADYCIELKEPDMLKNFSLDSLRKYPQNPLPFFFYEFCGFTQSLGRPDHYIHYTGTLLCAELISEEFPHLKHHISNVLQELYKHGEKYFPGIVKLFRNDHIEENYSRDNIPAQRALVPVPANSTNKTICDIVHDRKSMLH